MKKFCLIFLTILLIFGLKEVRAGTGDNVSGWAWSENVGWISFNCYNDYNGDGVLEDHCSSSNYGVKLQPDPSDPSKKVFSGYAWSEHIGWISFNRSETGAPPTEDPCFDGSCIAKLDPSTNKVYGWAKALAGGTTQSGGWDGWIKLNDANYGVTLNSSTGEFEGWATGWDDTPEEAVVGWISFNCKDGGYNEATGEHYSVCATSNYKVFLTAPSNQPPTVSNPTTTQEKCAWGSSPQVAPGLAITLHWTYSDQDGDLPAGYEVWIDTDSNFHNDDPRFKLKVEGTKSTSYTINLSDNQLTRVDKLTYPLSWNTTYHWKVRVKDSAGNWSDWSQVDSFTTPSHAYPYVNFTWSPQKPTVNQVVQFTDLSECYNSSNNVIHCNSWYWTFSNGTPPSSKNQNPTTTFSSIGKSEIILEVTGSSNYSCSVKKFLQTTYPLPFFKEIPPTFFKMKNFFASLISAVLKVKLF
jgi:hypothetical protein